MISLLLLDYKYCMTSFFAAAKPKKKKKILFADVVMVTTFKRGAVLY